MARVTFLDVLGIDTTQAETDQVAAALTVWPREVVQPVTGDLFNDDNFAELIRYLRDALDFSTVRPGAAADRAGLHAELHVDNAASSGALPLVLSAMPDLAFMLLDTEDHPAHVFVTRRDAGVELVVEGLPVEIQLPLGMIRPGRKAGATDAQPPELRDALLTAPFDVRQHDSLEIRLKDFEPTTIKVRINVRMTETFDFVVETLAPLSIGPCVFMDVPCAGLHDIQLIPSPRLAKDKQLPLEWTRHRLDWMELEPRIPGIITIRTIDLDSSAEPVAMLVEKFKKNRPAADPIELVIEDVALPLFSLSVPVPSHGTFGIRRAELEDPADAGGEAYQLQSAPIDFAALGGRLKIFRLLLKSPGVLDESIGDIDAVYTFGEDSDESWSLGITYTAEGLLLGNAILPEHERPHLFKILNTNVALAGFKLGCSILDPDTVEQKPSIVIPMGAADWANRLIGLLDVELVTAKEAALIEIQEKSGKDASPRVFRDLGWWLGGISIGALHDPDGIDFVVAGKLRIRIEELGYITDNNGASYLQLSGGIDLPFKAAKQQDASSGASAGTGENLEYGGGVHLHRLKLRMATAGAESHGAAIMLDGASLSIKVPRLTIEGFGALTEDTVDGVHYRELDFGARFKFDAFCKKLDLGFRVVYGTVSGTEDYTYWMCAAYLGFLPLGASDLHDLRILVAGNMTPVLDEPDGHAEPMRLFRWYKQNGDALKLPHDRKLSGWTHRDHSWAFGAGGKFSVAGTKAVALDIFFFMHASLEEAGLFGAVEAFLGKGDKPIAYGAIEWDIEHNSWGATIGVSLGLEKVIGDPNLPDALKRLASLTGTLWFGKNIDHIAIGQYADPSTWLTAKVEWTSPQLEAAIWGAFCVHHVDSDEGPHVLALTLGAKVSCHFAIGVVKAYATLSWVSGRWRNEALACGNVVHIELGIRIRVFHCFNFGASVLVELDWLGPTPTFKRQTAMLKIETPWWLPDVTIRWERVSGTPSPEDQTVCSSPITIAEAIPATRDRMIGIGFTSPLASANPRTTWSLTQLRGAPAPDVDDSARLALEPVGTDAVIALGFQPAVDGTTTVVPATPAGAGTQSSEKLVARYELVEIGIQRRPRFVPGAVWAPLLDPVTTHLDSLDGLPSPPELEAMFSPAVSFEWDRDVIRAQKLDPRRLLVNAETPFGFYSSNPEADDVAAQEPGWPCCRPERPKPNWHTVEFTTVAYGVRVPACQDFTASQSTLHWQGAPPPFVVPPVAAPAQTHPARVHLGAVRAAAFATASFDQRVAVCELYAYWKTASPYIRLVVEAYDGLERVGSQAFAMSATNPAAIVFDRPSGFTSLILRKEGLVEAMTAAASHWGPSEVELVRVRYRTVREKLDELRQQYRCKAADTRAHGGRIAWLPNHDYEITIKTRIELGYGPSGTQDTIVEQRAFFATKGLPGLNLVERIGDEVEPYVESRYPGPGAARLYRLEPLCVAFNERFNPLVPVDRVPDPSRPAETNQVLEWVLAVESVGGTAGFSRISQTSPDWIVAHRVVAPPILPRRPAVLGPGVFAAGVRAARALDPLRVRLDSLMDRPGGCSQGSGPKPSQVLVHQPVDPAAAADAVARWEPDRELRVNLRRKDAPFVERLTFDEHDASAFVSHAETGLALPWRSDGGFMRVDGTSAAVQWATFGEADWRHVNVRVTVDPEQGEAGVAVAVSPSGEAMKIVVGAGALRIIERTPTGEIERASSPLASGTVSPFALDVIAYDDAVRASIGEITVSAPLGNIRLGRLALVSASGGRFTSLTITGLDAFRFQARTSRYDTFRSHLGSWDGSLPVLRPGDVGTSATSVSALLATDADAIAEAMQRDADPQLRQRLFEKWTTQLALPLRERVAGIELTRWEDATGSSAILVESPEPLPFTRDVTVTLRTRRRLPIPPFPWPRPPRPPIPWLDIDDDTIVGPPLPDALRGTRRIVAARRGPHGAELHAYDVTVTATGIVAHWARPLTTVPRGLEGLELGELALVDENDVPLLPPLPPLPPFTYRIVPTKILSNSDETAAIIVPIDAVTPGLVAPLASGLHRLDFAIDRARWRAETPDAMSNYRDSATLVLTW